ncbi:unnamed protein product [Prunus armeniaca]|uniref:Uncharacterized protein n=1 Tax=Prunus armeniaca TaxID=36596 RepID=A0A6J5U422_PRUAR|nr:unnamed protein product [Prunus armeniaca]CAB4300756.1 unnamed protein product [Prunus armeniaca]
MDHKGRRHDCLGSDHVSTFTTMRSQVLVVAQSGRGNALKKYPAREAPGSQTCVPCGPRTP